MSEQIPVYHLDQIGEEHLGVAIFNFAHPPVADYSREMAQPHRHDHYCCFFIEEGEMEFFVDFQPVQVRQKSVLVSYPGQVHQSDAHQRCSGWMLVFDAKLINETAKMTIEGSGSRVALITLNSEESDWFRKLFELLNSVIQNRKDNLLHAQLTRSLLDSFIYQVCAFCKSQEDTLRQKHSSRSIDITNKFRHLVKQDFRTSKRPVEYAERLHFSVSYLNDTVKAVTGFSLTYFIQQEIIAEAQRLLYYSELSVREIAYALGYEDDKYFIRLFSKITGASPTHFRKSQRRK